MQDSKIYTDDWINAKDKYIQNPETFEIPTDYELEDIEINYLVKISNGIERFWVRILDIKNDVLIGTIDNKLAYCLNYDYKNLVMFEKNNIFEIHDLEFQNFIKKHIENKVNKKKIKKKKNN